MVQTEFLLSDIGRTFTAVNDSATTAIRAGDIVFAAQGSTSQLGSTVANSLTDYAYNDVSVKACRLVGTTTLTKRVIGVAITDAAAASQVTVAMEGIFLSPVDATATVITSGHPVKAADATTSGVDPLAQDYGTTSTALGAFYKIGRSLVGANSSKDYLLWKLTL
jgi:predicted RecA/RadA family phage recombinase